MQTEEQPDPPDPFAEGDGRDATGVRWTKHTPPRPYIWSPEAGKEVVYSRCTSWIDVLEDKSNLERWKQRLVLVGLIADPGLVDSLHATDPDDKGALGALADQAFRAGDGHVRAEKGTDLHSLSELADTDQELPTWATAEDRADMLAYRAAMERHGIEVLATERRVVLDDIKVTGTFDRVVRYQGRNMIADLKGLALTTPLPTPTGWTTMSAVHPGDQVLDAHGKPCTVTVKSETKMIGTYVVVFDDGSRVVCDSEHLWWTNTSVDQERTPTVKSIGEVAATLVDSRGQKCHKVPVADPLDLPMAALPIDPYLLGAWLGDGHVRDGVISKTDDLFTILEADGHQLGVRQRQPEGKEHLATRTVLGLRGALERAGLRHSKHVPPAYLRAGWSQRLRLLQGLMDTDGTWNTARRSAIFTSTDKALALAVVELLATLGQRPHINEVQAEGFGLTVTAYVVEFTPVGLNPFRLPRKADQAAVSTKRTAKARRRVIVAVEPGPDVDTACIAVDSPDHTYLCGERMIPTHNTGNVAYGAVKLGMQLAIYARGQVYDPRTHERRPFRNIDLDTGLIIHLSQGEARCDVYEVDLKLGWEACQVALQVRAMRGRSKDTLRLLP